MWIRICPAYTCNSSCCDNSTVITEETQSQYFFRLGPMRSSKDGWFCQNPNGQTRHWNSWWGPAPGIYLFPQVTYFFGVVGWWWWSFPRSLCACLGIVYMQAGGSPIYDGPNPRPFWSHFHKVTLRKEESTHLELALHLTRGGVCLASTFRGLDFWKLPHLWIVISGLLVQGWVAGLLLGVREVGA